MSAANPFREIAFSAWPFIEDRFQHPFEHPPIPIFTRDAVNVIDVMTGGYDGTYYCEQFVAITDPRYGHQWEGAHSGGNPNYFLTSDFSLEKMQLAMSGGDWGGPSPTRSCDPYIAPARPSYPYTGGRIAASVKVARDIFRVVYYELDGDYWRPVGLTFEPRPSETARWLETGAMLIAVVSVASAGAAFVAAQGAMPSLSAGLKFALSVDRLPGVDFGDVSDYLKYASKLTGSLDTASGLMSSLTDEAATAAGENVMWDDFLGDFVPTDVDFGGFGDFTVANPDDLFATGWFDFNNLAGESGAGFGYNFDFMPSFDDTLNSLTQSSGSIFGGIDFTKLVTDLASIYAQYRIADQQLEMQGQKPANSLPTPGQTRTLADGTILRTNNDGSTTIRAPDGSTRTVTASGQVVGSTPAPGGGSMLPGVSNQTLLIGGALAIGALMLFSRRKGQR